MYKRITVKSCALTKQCNILVLYISCTDICTQMEDDENLQYKSSRYVKVMSEINSRPRDKKYCWIVFITSQIHICTEEAYPSINIIRSTYQQSLYYWQHTPLSILFLNSTLHTYTANNKFQEQTTKWRRHQILIPNPNGTFAPAAAAVYKVSLANGNGSKLSTPTLCDSK